MNIITSFRWVIRLCWFLDFYYSAGGGSIIYSVWCTSIVPEVECDIAPLSDEGAINITWLYIHTGGLNLSSINLLYSIDQPHPQFRILADVPVPGKGTLGGEPFSFAVQDLPAGNSYIFSITSSNDKGNSSVTCPPVSHSIGKHWESVISLLNLLSSCLSSEVLPRNWIPCGVIWVALCYSTNGVTLV